MEIMSILIVNTVKILYYSFFDKKEKEENNKNLHKTIINTLEPFAKTVQYENKLIKEALSNNLDEIMNLSDDINNGFNSITNDLNSLNLKLDFIADSIISISNDLNIISNDINILMNHDYNVGLNHLEDFLLTNNQMEIEESRNSFVKAHSFSLERRDYSDEHYKQYIISTMSLVLTNYKYSEYHNGYKEVALKDLKNLLKDIIKDNKAESVIDTLKIYLLPFLNDKELKSKLIDYISTIYKRKIITDLYNFDFISAKNFAFELNSLVNDNLLLNDVLSITGDIELETDMKKEFMLKNSEYKKVFDYMKNSNFHLSKDNYFEFANNFNNEMILKFAFKGLYANAFYEDCGEFFDKFYIPDKDYRAKAYMILNSKIGKITELNDMKNFVLNNNNYSDDIKQLTYKL